MSELDRLGDIATICRTKNAGAFRLTIDVAFDDDALYARAKAALVPSLFADLYRVSADDVHVVPWDAARVIKATLPRWAASGSPGDRDVYGCQQHGPLLELRI
jgi:hypothetical protein